MLKSVFLKPCLTVCSIVILTTTILSGCSSSSSSSTPTTPKENYNGPGSKWDITLTGGTTGDFNIDHYQTSDLQNPDYNIQGPYVRQSSGFVTLTVGTVTNYIGTNGPLVGDTAWAVEAPGYAFLLKPTSGDQIIPMVESGNCPTADMTGNFVVVKKDLTNNGDSGADLAGNDFFGTFNYAVATGITSLPVLKAITAGFPDIAADTLPAGTCANGIMTFTDTILYLTTNGGGIVHLGVATPNDDTDDSFLFALSQKAITNVNNLDGNYAGILYDQNATIGQQIQPVTLACTSGSCTGNLVSDVTTGAAQAGTSAAVNLTGTVDSIANGLITGTISFGSTLGNLACMADIDSLSSGKKIISCVGQSPDNTANMFNVIFVSI
ncbi:hypothetical protein MNBD_GAMMA09-2682 [hydrothermal vent metagenome]|uniref:Uncharacterized protein n=1 Tax=hydrothermal vent metagenome TaxID=652676 RepID=A0A3B0Y698_9ZZZZ